MPALHKNGSKAKPCRPNHIGWLAIFTAISFSSSSPWFGVGLSQAHGQSNDPTLRGSFKNQSLFLADPFRNQLEDRSRLRDTIKVDVHVSPARYLHGKIYVPTGANLTAKAEISDDRFKNATIDYQWSVKNKTITTLKNASEITYKFDEADENNFLEVLVFHHPNDTGVSNKSLVVRDPVAVADPIGKLFLEHGELLNITLELKGTGPFYYCNSFCFSRHDKDHEMECEDCSPHVPTKSSEVKIIHYLHLVGNWTLSFVVDNIASQVTKSYSIKITENIRPKSVPFVPIVSSILAVIILLSGVALHLKFKQSFATETADFDFIRDDYNDPDETFWDEELSFAQRIRYILFMTPDVVHDSMTDSNRSGLRFY